MLTGLPFVVLLHLFVLTGLPFVVLLHLFVLTGLLMVNHLLFYFIYLC